LKYEEVIKRFHELNQDFVAGKIDAKSVQQELDKLIDEIKKSEVYKAILLRLMKLPKELIAEQLAVIAYIHPHAFDVIDALSVGDEEMIDELALRGMDEVRKIIKEVEE